MAGRILKTKIEKVKFFKLPCAETASVDVDEIGYGIIADAALVQGNRHIAQVPGLKVG